MKLQQIIRTLSALGCVLLTASVGSAVEAFEDDFLGAPLDPAWSNVGLKGRFMLGGYALGSQDGGQTGLSLGTIGPGDFQMTIKWIGMAINGQADTQIHFTDGGGYIMIVQVYRTADGDINLNLVPLGGPPWAESVELPAALTALSLRITWQDDPAAGRGGTWLIEYDANNSGSYTAMAMVPSSLYLSDAAPDRTFRFWTVALTETAIIVNDYFAIEPIFQTSDPMPADGATGVDPTVDPTWVSGTGATGSDVYFGVSQADVDAATPGDPRGVYQSGVTASPLVLDTLDLDTTYFWRIDDIDPDTGSPVKGPVWEFTTASRYLLELYCVDDFESYADTAALQTAWPGSSEATLENVTVRGGAQAMSVAATANLEIEHTLSAAEDWSNFNSLTLWCKGDPANTAVNATLRVIVKDDQGDWLTQKTAYGQALSGEWFPLVITAKDDWTSVGAVTIALANIGSGETAQMYFDDLCLQYDCAAAGNQLAGDLNSDCRSDIQDLSQFVAEWLDCTYDDPMLCQ